MEVWPFNNVHARLISLQGGSAGQYYHLTSSQHTEITTFFSLTDITGTEAETLTNNSIADGLHKHSVIAGITISGTPSVGQILTATSGSTANWQTNSHSNSFVTIDCPTGTDPVADSTTDTLTLSTANSLLTISGNSTTDTITFTVVNSAIDHGLLTGLSDDDHTIYALLAGRSGGQTINGGTASGNNLTLVSTSHSTKGDVIFTGDLAPSADNTYDLGTGSNRIKRMITVEGEEISALNYAFRVTGTTSGLYFDSGTPRNFAFHINGSLVHVFYSSGSDEGAFYHIPRTTDPPNATTNGTMYVKDDGAGVMTLMIRSAGAWVAV